MSGTDGNTNQEMESRDEEQSENTPEKISVRASPGEKVQSAAGIACGVVEGSRLCIKKRGLAVSGSADKENLVKEHPDKVMTNSPCEITEVKNSMSRVPPCNLKPPSILKSTQQFKTPLGEITSETTAAATKLFAERADPELIFNEFMSWIKQCCNTYNADTIETCDRPKKCMHWIPIDDLDTSLAAKQSEPSLRKQGSVEEVDFVAKQLKETKTLVRGDQCSERSEPDFDHKFANSSATMAEDMDVRPSSADSPTDQKITSRNTTTFESNQGPFDGGITRLESKEVAKEKTLDTKSKSGRFSETVTRVLSTACQKRFASLCGELFKGSKELVDNALESLCDGLAVFAGLKVIPEAFPEVKKYNFVDPITHMMGYPDYKPLGEGYSTVIDTINSLVMTIKERYIPCKMAECPKRIHDTALLKMLEDTHRMVGEILKQQFHSRHRIFIFLIGASILMLVLQEMMLIAPERRNSKSYHLMALQQLLDFSSLHADKVFEDLWKERSKQIMPLKRRPADNWEAPQVDSSAKESATVMLLGWEDIYSTANSRFVEIPRVGVEETVNIVETAKREREKYIIHARLEFDKSLGFPKLTSTRWKTISKNLFP